MASKSLPWESRTQRELVRLAWPICVSTLSYSVMTLVDTLLVGHLGAASLAGVGLGGTVAFVFLCFAFGLLRGAKTLVAQALGAGRADQVGAYRGAALLMAAGVGVVCIGGGQLAAAVVARITSDPEAGAAARSFLSIRILGAPMALCYVALREVRYAEGDAQSPMRATLVANLANIVLASLFVLVFRWGVAGAAWATVIAHGVEAGWLALRQRRDGFDVRRMRFEHLRALWRIGLPTGLQFTLEVGSFALLAALIAHMGTREMAAHQIAMQVIHFSFLPVLAVSEAASVLAGQAVGAGRLALVGTVARAGMTVTLGYTVSWTLAMGLCAPLLVAGFSPTPDVAAVAITLLHVAALFQVLDGAQVVARGVLRGAGDVRVPAVVGVVTAWIATPPLTYLLGDLAGLGALGGWLGLLVEITLASAILWWRLARGHWHAAATRSRAELDAAASASMEPTPSRAIVDVAAEA